MTSISSLRYLFTFLLVNLYLKSIAANSNLTFSFKNFGKDSNFESELALYGNAKLSNVSSSVQFTGSGVFSTGRVFFKKPLNLVEKKSRNMVSFSNSFVFSMSKENWNRLAFVMVPNEFYLNEYSNGSMGKLVKRRMKFLAIELFTFRNVWKYGDLNWNYIWVDVISDFVIRRNLSSTNFVLNGEEKLQAWIDYEATSKRFEVRLCKLRENKPIDTLLSFLLDLSKMWKLENVSIGLNFSSENSSQKSNLYSWSFSSRTIPHWMHSDPMNPENFMQKEDNLKVPKKSNCVLKILGTLLFGTGCGAAGAFLVLFVWTMLGNKRPVMPKELSVKPPKDIEFEKFNVVVVKTVDGKKLDV